MTLPAILLGNVLDILGIPLEDLLALITLSPQDIAIVAHISMYLLGVLCT